ncbi:methyltransferase [Kitasatospora sp. MMS16-BH015]|uniref:methyltransferase n=1 Tax=Kitasatospora sp. MMS16-BH015 TaxID=2018025 RepID=UPI000CA2D4DA|nr:methyltransferase [Kitasatospora sp. MMS16-BH015]AUG78918.1 methyltransferase [Kitasatospora sp. MMS16-BH015]
MTTTVENVGTAAHILQLGNRFCTAKALLTAVRLDLFTVLDEGPATTEGLRQRLGLHGRGLADFLELLTSLGLLRRDADGRYRNAEGADRFLVASRPGAVGGFLRGADINLYPVYADLAQALRTGRPQGRVDYTGMLDDPVATGHFVRMMDGLTQGLGVRLLAALEGVEYRSVLDVGGCRGHLLGQLLAARPGLEGHVFDLPQLEPFFHEYQAELGRTGQAVFHPGDFFQDALPSADVLVLGHILHDWDPAQRQQLLDKAYRAVNPGGALLVYDRMLGELPDDTENLVASLNMLLVTEGGAEYTVAEIGAQARAAGFTEVTHRPLADFDTLVLCRKAG